MIKTIDVQGLSEEQTRLVQEFVEFLRAKAAKKEKAPRQAQEVKFRSWPLSVKGPVTREEIYDHL